ncbi:MAG: hypothetical protein DMG43_07325 [Acidobacteria bacterium]|nr:MAG: hypothetical protein DMG43_07325 [Acidobacteriota bacterium]
MKNAKQGRKDENMEGTPYSLDGKNGSAVSSRKEDTWPPHWFEGAAENAVQWLGAGEMGWSRKRACARNQMRRTILGESSQTLMPEK